MHARQRPGHVQYGSRAPQRARVATATPAHLSQRLVLALELAARLEKGLHRAVLVSDHVRLTLQRSRNRVRRRALRSKLLRRGREVHTSERVTRRSPSSAALADRGSAH